MALQFFARVVELVDTQVSEAYLALFLLEPRCSLMALHRRTEILVFPHVARTGRFSKRGVETAV